MGEILLLFLIGSLAGLVAGFLGIGGGVIVIPVMLFYLEPLFDDQYIYLIVSTIALSVAFTSSIFGSYRHIKNRNLYFHTLTPIAIGSVLGTIPGSILSEITSTSTLKAVLALILIFVSFKMFSRKISITTDSQIKDSPLPLFLAGFTVGGFSALTGLGGGVIFVPILTTFFLFNPKKAAGTSAFVMIFNTFPAIFYRVFLGDDIQTPFISYGYLIPKFVIPLIIGTAIFSQIGAHLNHKISTERFRKVAATIFLLLSMRMIFNVLSQF